MATLLLKLAEEGDKSIRGIIDSRGVQVFSIYDFMTKACGKHDSGGYARSLFKRLTDEGAYARYEVLTATHYVKFPGAGQRETPCMTIRGLQRLLMILGGKVDAEFRRIVEGTFARVMAGDHSLIEVIQANAASEGPVQQAYREVLEEDQSDRELDESCLKNANEASEGPVQQAFRAPLAQEPVVPAVDELFLTKKREREEASLDLDLEERKMNLAERKKREELALEEGKLALEERKLALEERKLSLIAEGVKHVSSISQDGVFDPEFKQRVQGYINNVMLFSSNSLGVPVLIAHPVAPPVAPVARVGGAGAASK